MLIMYSYCCSEGRCMRMDMWVCIIRAQLEKYISFWALYVSLFLRPMRYNSCICYRCDGLRYGNSLCGIWCMRGSCLGGPHERYPEPQRADSPPQRAISRHIIYPVYAPRTSTCSGVSAESVVCVVIRDNNSCISCTLLYPMFYYCSTVLSLL